MLRKIGGWCAKHRWTVIVSWIVVLVVVWAIGIGLGGKPNNQFTLPGSESQDALDLLEKDFPEKGGARATVVYETSGDTKVTDRAVKANIEKSVADLKALPDVASVLSPFGALEKDLVASDGRAALAEVQYTKDINALPKFGAPAFSELEQSIKPYQSATLEIYLGGDLPALQMPAIDPSLVLLGLLVALIILLLALGTWTSFFWPVVGALVGVALGAGFTQILESFVDVPLISNTVAVMIGLGVGIDYGLFVVASYKEEMAQCGGSPDAAKLMMNTAGRAVFTAGSTIIVALLALLIFGLPAMNAMAYSVILTVGAVILAALTLQTAVLSLMGERLGKAQLPWEKRGRDPEKSIGHRWTHFVTRFAPVAFVVGLAVLLVLAIPVFKGELNLGPADNSQMPPGSTQYKAWKVQTDKFGPGSTDPFLVVAKISDPNNDVEAETLKLVEATAKTQGVATVSPPEVDSSKTLAVFQVVPTTSSQNPETADLVKRLRNDTIPKVTGSTDVTALVTGTNAVFVDLDERIASRLPLFVLIVVGIAYLILMTVFRSLLIPLKAAAFNIVTILATYGVLIAVFQWGWGLSIFGIPQAGSIFSLLAPVVFAVLFGLSNDYETYLLTRMREEYVAGSPAKEAVRKGQAAGSRVVVAAAVVMTFVFFSYAFQPGTGVKQYGLGLSIAIVLDCFITRMTMLPSLMYMGGKAMWWFPKWLDRILPRLEQERSDSGPQVGDVSGRNVEAPIER